MVSSDFRAKAREKLAGKWKTAVLMVLVTVVFSYVLSLIENHTTGLLRSIISIVTVIVDIPLTFGLTYAFLNLFDEKETAVFDPFKLAYENFKISWSVAWHKFLKLLLPAILVIVSVFLMAMGGAFLFANSFLGASANSSYAGLTSSSTTLLVIGIVLFVASDIWLTVKSYYYAVSSLVAIENPEMTGKEAVEKSKTLMTGNRGKLFVLELSFIGWALLACLTFGIGILWLSPYVTFAKIAFYKHLIGSTEVATETPVENTQE